MKKIVWTFALGALMLASCSNEENVATAVDNPDLINFRTTTTRAAINNLTTMQGSNTGFVVYGTSGTSPTGWFAGVDGTNNYKYAAGTWAWAGVAPSWPTATSGYPMNFYAYFPAGAAGMTLNPTTPTPTAFKGNFIIQNEAAQMDFLEANSSTASKPGSGLLTMTFNHIFSKINFGVIPGYGTTVHLQSIKTSGLGNNRIYDFIADDWGVQPPAFTSGYDYLATSKPAVTMLGTDAAEGATGALTPTYSNLMLMPQTATTWTPGPTVSNAYMSAIYRLQATENPNAVGYAIANNHPNYSSLTAPQQALLNNEPLFVKVGYPFAPSQITWTKGKGYTYNICLGTANATNGYLLDNRYYDEDGTPTTLLITGKNTGDPVSNGKINFIVKVTDWNDQSAATTY